MPQVAKTLKAANGQTIGFLEYIPASVANDSTKKYPVILFGHGISERGDGTTQIQNVATQGIPRLCRDGVFSPEMMVISPQLSSSYGSWQPFYGQEMLKYAKAHPNVDTNKIYLAGLSLGGGFIYNLLADATTAQDIVAILPAACVGGNATAVAANVKKYNIAVQAFHNNNDPTVSPGQTAGMIKAMNDVGVAIKPIFTLFVSGGHEWNRAFSVVDPGPQPALDYYNNYAAYTWVRAMSPYDWLMQYSKGVTPPPPPPPPPPPGDPVPDIAITAQTSTSILVDASGSQNVASYPQTNDAYKWGFETIVPGSWSNTTTPSGQFGGPVKSWTNISPGTYKITLTVKGINGKVVTTTKTVVVTSGGTPPPVTITGLIYSDGNTYRPVKVVKDVVLDYTDGTSEMKQ